MNNSVTTSLLILLTLLSMVGSVTAIIRLRSKEPNPKAERLVTGLCLALTLLGAATLVGRWARLGEVWRPLHAHVDGLLLISTLVAVATLYFRLRPRMRGLSAFALPVLTLLLAWAVCASWWTYRLFHLESLSGVWSVLHLTTVYLGTLCFVLAAAAGGMYLYVQARLKRKDDPAHMGRLASLETLENMVIHASAVGFVLMTLGLIGGVVVLTQHPDAMGPGWWYTPKVVLAAIAWGIYALLINVRHTASFRGNRAAWLAIAGLVLLIAVYGIATALPARGHNDQPQPAAITHTGGVVQASVTEATPCAS